MYTPSKQIVTKYASVIIDGALNNGKGIKKGDTVYLSAPLASLPLTRALYQRVLERGGNPILNIIDDEFKRLFLTHASKQQLLFYPEAYYSGIAGSIDHGVYILSEHDPLFLAKVDPKKIMLSHNALKPYRNLLEKKEDAGKFSWTLCVYGTEGMAKEAGLSQQQYWKQIVQACYLDQNDPVKQWKDIFTNIKSVEKKLNTLPIKHINIRSKNTDLLITLGERRRWVGCSGSNIPSFEIFTSPDWRGTEGVISFDMPLYQHGNMIKNIMLEFRNGVVVKAKARKNEKLLHAILKQKNGDKIGEFSLTDRRFSRINRYMANGLYDENFGGSFGNTHIALGNSYHDTLAGDVKKLTEDEFAELGFNKSVEHVDIIATTDREVTAILHDNSKKVIYSGGCFLI